MQNTSGFQVSLLTLVILFLLLLALMKIFETELADVLPTKL